MDSHLLVTKIVVPSRRPDVLRRQRLLDFMHEYLGRKLLLVSAAAGYGKTSLLVDFVHDTELPVCWYSLDEGDRDPQVLLEYLVAAMQRKFPHFGGRTTALLRGGEEKHSPDTYIGTLVTEVYEQIHELFVLVLDDYHLVEESQPVNQLLDRLLAVLPENIRLVLASRTVPAYLTLTRLTAKQQVAGLGASDLRFTADEIRALVQQNYGLEISPAIAEGMATESDGWITGIVLTTPVLWRGLMHEWIKGHGTGSQLFDYLATEVLAQQPADMQEFLLETSVLPEMDVTWCNELLGRSDAGKLLALAEKRNLFLIRLEEHGYRYHHLFRDFMQTRLRESEPGRYRDLLCKAAGLFERHGKLDLAIELWFGAEEPAEAARLTGIVVEDYYRAGRWATLARWLDQLPEETLNDAPDLMLWRARMDDEMGEREPAQAMFDRAIEEFERRKDKRQVARALIESARHEALMDTAIARCERALALVPEREHALHAQGYFVMGMQKEQHGDHAGAIPLLERAGTLFELANQRSEQSDVENHLGAAYQSTGDRTRAMRHLENARAVRQRVGNAVKLASTLNNLAVAFHQQGDPERASALLEEALSHAVQAGNLRVEAFVLASRGDIERDRGKLADALQSYTRAATIAEKIREHSLITYTRVCVAEVWRMAGGWETAELALEAALQSANAHQSEYEFALVQLGFGALRLGEGEPEAAERHLESALPVLERAGAAREVGRAYFCLAEAALQRKRRGEAVRHLQAVAALGKRIGEDQFLVSQATTAWRALVFATARRVGGAYFRTLGNKLKHGGGGQLIEFPAGKALTELELFTFGEARVVMDGTPVPRGAWQTGTTKELFFFFATLSQGWRKEQIFEALWSHLSRGQANDLFHASLYRIRRALFPECIVFRNGLYQLNPEMALWSDAQEFEEARREAAADRSADAQIEALERMVTLYRADYLEEFYSDFWMMRREQLRTQYLDGLIQLGRLRMERGDTGRAQDLMQRALASERTREEVYRGLMELAFAMGNRAGVTQVYEQCEKVLKEELGVEPSAETSALYRRLLRGDGSSP
jgi:ATP/maltotriose-dependent transcriptional regulator MalT